jgi:hypothetical protein
MGTFTPELSNRLGTPKKPAPQRERVKEFNFKGYTGAAIRRRPLFPRKHPAYRILLYRILVSGAMIVPPWSDTIDTESGIGFVMTASTL